MSKYTILLVDDELNVLAALKRCLAMEEDFVVRAVLGPEEAMRVLESEPVDVVISDQDMPRMRGLEFLAQVCVSHPNVVRLMLSGKADLKQALNAVNEDLVYRFLLKPWQDDELRLMIRLSIRHRDDQMRVRELSRIVRSQAAMFAEILSRHPDCKDILEGYLRDVSKPAGGEATGDELEEVGSVEELEPVGVD